MKYIKKFENLTNDNLNKFLLIDCSGSFMYDVKRILKYVNLYLSDRFTAILCTWGENIIINNVNLKELNSKIKNHALGGSDDDIQNAISYIGDKKLDGNVLVITDGYIKLDVSNIKNNISILYTESQPIVLGDPTLFKDDLESLDQFYPPRDESFEEYELKKSAKKYNL